MTDEVALARAEKCRRIAEELAATPIARENWHYLAQHWEQAAGRDPDQDQKHTSRHWQVEQQS
jgi:hypothetical protein